MNCSAAIDEASKPALIVALSIVIFNRNATPDSAQTKEYTPTRGRTPVGLGGVSLKLAIAADKVR